MRWGTNDAGVATLECKGVSAQIFPPAGPGGRFAACVNDRLLPGKGFESFKGAEEAVRVELTRVYDALADALELDGP